MGLIYSSTPSSTGGFNPTYSGREGYYNFSQGLPWYAGRSQIASIPEFMRNPQLFENNMVVNLREGRANLMKLLFEYAQQNGVIEVPDVKPRWKININPHDRFYLKTGTYEVSSNETTLYLSAFDRPTPAISNSLGNPKVVGDIARIEVGDILVMMFSYVNTGRTTTTPSYTNSAPYFTPKPELVKVKSIDTAAGSLVVTRNWAGSQRTTSANITSNFSVVTTATGGSARAINTADAFFVKMPRSVKEDEIDAKVFGGTPTWGETILKRTLKAWGSGYFAEVINKNVGNPSQAAKDKQFAIDSYYGDMEYDCIWGEKSEGWDAETGDWYGTTDGLLANVHRKHYIGLVPVAFGQLKTNPAYALGSFDPLVFNKVMLNKVLTGNSGQFVLSCGGEFHANFASMINLQTQNVPTIQSEWKVVGHKFTTSDGATIEVIPSDKMTLNGMTNMAIMFEKPSFRILKLKNYPTDILEVNNENPLKKNGFIHGVYGFRNDNPDATWVFMLDEGLAGNRDDADFIYNYKNVSGSDTLNYNTSILGVNIST